MSPQSIQGLAARQLCQSNTSYFQNIEDLAEIQFLWMFYEEYCTGKMHRCDVNLKLDLAWRLRNITADISSGLMWEQGFFTTISTLPFAW